MSLNEQIEKHGLPGLYDMHTTAVSLTAEKVKLLKIAKEHLRLAQFTVDVLQEQTDEAHDIVRKIDNRVESLLKGN